MAGSDALTAIRELEADGVVSFCTACEGRVAVLGCEHDSTVVFNLDGTIHRSCLTGLVPSPVVTFNGAYAGLSYADLLEEARRIQAETGPLG